MDDHGRLVGRPTHRAVGAHEHRFRLGRFAVGALAGRCERELGLLASAQASYERSLQALPTYENGFFGLGLVQEDLGNDRAAR